jgi:hypothetical protein
LFGVRVAEILSEERDKLSPSGNGVDIVRHEGSSSTPCGTPTQRAMTMRSWVTCTLISLPKKPSTAALPASTLCLLHPLCHGVYTKTTETQRLHLPHTVSACGANADRQKRFTPGGRDPSIPRDCGGVQLPQIHSPDTKSHRSPLRRAPVSRAGACNPRPGVQDTVRSLPRAQRDSGRFWRDS